MVIDTGIFIEHLRAKDKTRTTLYQLAENDVLCISVVSVYELYMGATTPDKVKDVGQLITGLTILPFDDAVAITASEIFLKLKRNNKLIEFRDIFIAATCITNELPIATLNKKHFKRVDNLKILR